MAYKIGLITGSFGRAVNTLAGAHFLANSRHDSRTQNLLNRTFWIFPQSNCFPFLTKALKKYLVIIPERWAILYRILSKFTFISRFFVVSQDDFNDFAVQAYSFSHKTFEMPEDSTSFERFNVVVSKKKINLDNLILVHLRDSSWDLENGLSLDYIKSQEYRNSNMVRASKLIQILLSLGYSVITTGRIQTKQVFNFDDKFFDYARWAYSTDEIDFFLWSKCVAAIGTLNGGCQPGFLFKKRFLILDYSDPISTIHQSFPLYALGDIYVLPRPRVDAQVQYEQSNLSLISSESLECFLNDNAANEACWHQIDNIWVYGINGVSQASESFKFV